MAINVMLNEQNSQEKKFPKLMIACKNAGSDDGIIVLFTEASVGTVIKTVKSSEKYISYQSSNFYMECFIDYNEPITIQNY